MPGRGHRRTPWMEVRNFALSLPGAWEDSPWDEVVVKVGKKIFVFLGSPEQVVPSISVKLTASHGHAMSVPGAEPTGYGMGKAGWVTVPLASTPGELGCDWIEESYRNIAPKKLTAQLADRR